MCNLKIYIVNFFSFCCFSNNDLVSTEIVRLVLEYLNNEPPTSNRFATLAEKLNMPTTELQLSIKALVLLTVETVKKNVSVKLH